MRLEYISILYVKKIHDAYTLQTVCGIQYVKSSLSASLMGVIYINNQIHILWRRNDATCTRMFCRLYVCALWATNLVWQQIMQTEFQKRTANFERALSKNMHSAVTNNIITTITTTTSINKVVARLRGETITWMPCCCTAATCQLEFFRNEWTPPDTRWTGRTLMLFPFGLANIIISTQIN